MLRGGSRSFFAASLLLPRRVHQPATAVYAFCRLADDAIDSGGGTAALAQMRDRLDRAYRGWPLPIAADRALAEVVARHRVPRVLLDALLEGFEWDAAGRRYEDLAELHAYAARVAGTVGAVMALLMGVRNPDVMARACDLGVAMQLSNIARDVGEDARAGRLYLPQSWLREAGIDPDAWLARPECSEALASVVQRLLDSAEILYARADAGIARLPLACRPGIGAARRLYAEIGREVARNGFESVTRRARVSPTRKAGLLARSMVAAISPGPAISAPPLDAVHYLVEAVAAATSSPTRPARRKGLEDRVVWLLDLFEQLEQRQAPRHGRTSAERSRERTA